VTYRRRRTVVGKARATHSAIGEWRKPRAQGQPGYVRVDTVHQGDHDGANRHPSRPSPRRRPVEPHGKRRRARRRQARRARLPRHSRNKMPVGAKIFVVLSNSSFGIQNA